VSRSAGDPVPGRAVARRTATVAALRNPWSGINEPTTTATHHMRGSCLKQKSTSDRKHGERQNVRTERTIGIEPELRVNSWSRVSQSPGHDQAKDKEKSLLNATMHLVKTERDRAAPSYRGGGGGEREAGLSGGAVGIPETHMIDEPSCLKYKSGDN